jgi:hypothetical protein
MILLMEFRVGDRISADSSEALWDLAALVRAHCQSGTTCAVYGQLVGG